MQILCNKDGYVESFAMLGNLTDGLEITEPDNISHFREHFQSYRIHGDSVAFDADWEEQRAVEDRAEETRRLRETECFPVVNRGQLWYEQLTEGQRSELDAWYKAWLDVTETGAIPVRPEWL